MSPKTFGEELAQINNFNYFNLFALIFVNLHSELELTVAMTRPTHLLCLALRQSALGEGTKALKRRQALQDRGWHIVELGLPGPSVQSSPIPGPPPAVIAP